MLHIYMFNMVKKTTSLTIDDDIIKKAKLKGLNISQFTEHQLKRFLEGSSKGSKIVNKERDKILRNEAKLFYEETGDDFRKFLDGRIRRINRALDIDVNKNELETLVLEAKQKDLKEGGLFGNK